MVIITDLFSENYLAHYGTPRHSGRYPYGSGKRPQAALREAGKLASSNQDKYTKGADAAQRILTSKGGFNSASEEVVALAAMAAAYAVYAGVAYAVHEIPRTRLVNGKVLAKQEKQETTEESLTKVNPTMDMYNCALCSVAGVLRMEGYDVVARTRDSKAATNYDKQLKKMFPDGDVHKEDKANKFATSREDAAQELKSKYGDNASGVIAMYWKGMPGSGHAIAWKITDGNVEFLDFQIGASNEQCSKYWGENSGWDPNQGIVYARLDNSEPDTKYIYRAVKNARKV